MNSIFSWFFLLLAGLSAFRDMRGMKRRKTSLRVIYVLLLAASLGLFVCKRFDLPVPMPSYFFIRIVSPWIGNSVGL